MFWIAIAGLFTGLAGVCIGTSLYMIGYKFGWKAGWNAAYPIAWTKAIAESRPDGHAIVVGEPLRKPTRH